jgi:hypothetical protein
MTLEGHRVLNSSVLAHRGKAEQHGARGGKQYREQMLAAHAATGQARIGSGTLKASSPRLMRLPLQQR